MENKMSPGKGKVKGNGKENVKEREGEREREKGKEREKGMEKEREREREWKRNQKTQKKSPIKKQKNIPLKTCSRHISQAELCHGIQQLQKVHQHVVHYPRIDAPRKHMHRLLVFHF